MAERKPSALTAQPAPRAVAPVAIPISDSTAASTEDEVRDSDADAEVAEAEERAVEAG